MAFGEDLAAPVGASRWEQGEFEGPLFAYGPTAAPGGGPSAALASSTAHGTVRLAEGCRGLLADDGDQVNGCVVAAFVRANIDSGQRLRWPSLQRHLEVRRADVYHTRGALLLHAP